MNILWFIALAVILVYSTRNYKAPISAMDRREKVVARFKKDHPTAPFCQSCGSRETIRVRKTGYCRKTGNPMYHAEYDCSCGDGLI